MKRVAPVALAIATSGRALEYKHLCGSWCSATAKIIFNSNIMTVTLFADHKPAARKVARYDYRPATARMHWLSVPNEDATSDFGAFSHDDRTMFLQKSKSTPNREYHSC